MIYLLRPQTPSLEQYKREVKTPLQNNGDAGLPANGHSQTGNFFPFFLSVSRENRIKKRKGRRPLKIPGVVPWPTRCWRWRWWPLERPLSLSLSLSSLPVLHSLLLSCPVCLAVSIINLFLYLLIFFFFLSFFGFLSGNNNNR